MPRHLCYIIILLFWSFVSSGQSISEIRQYTTANELPAQTIERIGQNEQGYILVETSNGTVTFNGYDFQLTRISIQEPIQEVASLEIPENFNPFFSEKSISCHFWDRQGSLWIGTSNNGLFYLPNRDADAENNVRIEFVGLNNQKDTNPSDTITIPHTFETLSIGYASLDYTAMGTTTYRYQIEGRHDQWIETKDSKIQFTALPNGGNYTFKVAAKSQNGAWGQPATIGLIFEVPFYRTTWFFGFVFVSILAMLWGITRLYFKRKLKIQNLNSQLLQWEGKALQSQMNPHFMFNALNSIQSFIARGDTYTSEMYLAKFASLLRKTLQYSKESHISLSQEIEQLNTYLDVEKMRFGDRLEFEILIDESIDKEMTKLPPMLLQPFVENAIIHGLTPKKDGGFIAISFNSKNEHFLHCTIEDNGIGRNKSQVKEHNSLGTDIVSKRLSILTNNRENHIIYTDKKDPSGESTGTKVELKIPVQW